MATEVDVPESALIMEKEEVDKACSNGTSRIKIDECPPAEKQHEKSLPDKSQESIDGFKGGHVSIDNEKNNEEELKDSHDTSLSTEGQYSKEDSSPAADTKIDPEKHYSSVTVGDEITESQTISDSTENAFTESHGTLVVAEPKSDTISKDYDSANIGTLKDDSGTTTEESQEPSLEMKQPSNEYDISAMDNVRSSSNDRQSSSSEKPESIGQVNDTENNSLEEVVEAIISETAADNAEEVPELCNQSTAEPEDNYTVNLPVEKALEMSNHRDSLHASVPLEVVASGEDSPTLVSIQEERPKSVHEEVLEAQRTNDDKNTVEEVKDEEKEMPTQNLERGPVETDSAYTAVHDQQNREACLHEASEGGNSSPEEFNQAVSMSNLTLEEEHHGSAENAEKDTKPESIEFEGDGSLQKLQISAQANESSEEQANNFEPPHAENIQAVNSTENQEGVVLPAAKDEVWEKETDAPMPKESEDVKEESDGLAYPTNSVSEASEQHVDDESLGTANKCLLEKPQETLTGKSAGFSSEEVDHEKDVPELELHEKTEPEKESIIILADNGAAEKAETSAENELQDDGADMLVVYEEIQSVEIHNADETVEGSVEIHNADGTVEGSSNEITDEAVIETDVADASLAAAAAASGDSLEKKPSMEILSQEETVQLTESENEGTYTDQHIVYETPDASLATTIDETVLQNQESKTSDFDGGRGGSTKEVEEDYNATERMDSESKGSLSMISDPLEEIFEKSEEPALEETKEDGKNVKPEITRTDGEYVAAPQSLELENQTNTTDDKYTEASDRPSSSPDFSKEAKITDEEHATDEKDASTPIMESSQEASITSDDFSSNDNHSHSCEDSESIRQVSENKSSEEVEVSVSETVLDKAEKIPELGCNQSTVEPAVIHSENLLDEKALDPLHATVPHEVAASGEDSPSPISIQEQPKSVQEEILDAQPTSDNENIIEEVEEEKMRTQHVESSTVETNSDYGVDHIQNNIDELINQAAKDVKSSSEEFNQDIIPSNLTLEEHLGNPENAEEDSKPEPTKEDDEFLQEVQITAQAKESSEKANNLEALDVEDICHVNSNKILEAVIPQTEEEVWEKKEVPMPKEIEETKEAGEELAHRTTLVSEASEERVDDESLDTSEINLHKKPEETVERTSTGFSSEQADHVKSISELESQSQTEPGKESITGPAENRAAEKAETCAEIDSPDHSANVLVDSGEIQSVEYHDADKNVVGSRNETSNVDPECESVEPVVETNVADASTAAAGGMLEEMPPVVIPNQEQTVEVIERENDGKNIDESIVYDTSDASYATIVNETLLQIEETKISDSDDSGGPTNVMGEEDNGTEVMESESNRCLSATDPSDENFHKTKEPTMEVKREDGENVKPEDTSTNGEQLAVYQSVEIENHAIVTEEQTEAIEQSSPEKQMKGRSEEKDAITPTMKANEGDITTSDNSVEKLEEHKAIDQNVAEESGQVSIEEEVADYSPKGESLQKDLNPEAYPGIKMASNTEVITEPDDSTPKEITSYCTAEENEEKKQDQSKEQEDLEVKKPDEITNCADGITKTEEPEMINATEKFLHEEEVAEIADDPVTIAEQVVHNSFPEEEKEEKNVYETNKIDELKPAEEMSEIRNDPSHSTEIRLEGKVTELPHQVSAAEETEDHFQEANAKSFGDGSIDEPKLEFEGPETGFINENVDKAEVEPPHPQDSIVEVIDDNPGVEVKATPITNQQLIQMDSGVTATETCESISNASESTMVDIGLNSNEEIKEEMIVEGPSQVSTEEIPSEEEDTTTRDASETEIDKEMIQEISKTTKSDEQETAEAAEMLNTEMENQGKDIEKSVAEESLTCNPAEEGNDERNANNITKCDLKPTVDPEVKLDEISEITKNASPSIKLEETDVIVATPIDQELEQPCPVLTAEKTMNFALAEGKEEDYVSILSKENDIKSEVCREVAEDEISKTINGESESAKMTDAKQMTSEDKFIISEEPQHLPASDETAKSLQEDVDTKVNDEIVIDELSQQVEPEVGANEMPETAHFGSESTKVEGDNKIFGGPPQFSDPEEISNSNPGKECEERDVNDTTLDKLEQEKVNIEISKVEETDTIEATQSLKDHVDEEPGSPLTVEKTVNYTSAEEQKEGGDITNSTQADEVKSEVLAEVVQSEISKTINNESPVTKMTSEGEAITIEGNHEAPMSEEIVNNSLPEEEGRNVNGTTSTIDELDQKQDAPKEGIEVVERSPQSPNKEEVVNDEPKVEKKEEQNANDGTTLAELQPEVRPNGTTDIINNANERPKPEEFETNDLKSSEETGVNPDEKESTGRLEEHHVSETEPVYEANEDCQRSNDFIEAETNHSVSNLDRSISQELPHDEKEEREVVTEGRDGTSLVDESNMETAKEDDLQDLTEANDNSGTIHVPVGSAIAESDVEVAAVEDLTGTHTKIASQDEEDTIAQKGLTGEKLQPGVELEDASKAGTKPLNSIPQESSLNDDKGNDEIVEEQGKLSTDTSEKKLLEDENEDKKNQNQDQYPSLIVEQDSAMEVHSEPNLLSDITETGDQNDNPNMETEQKDYLTDSKAANMPFESTITTGTDAKIARQDEVMLIPEKCQSGTPQPKIQAMELQDASESVAVAVSSFSQESSFEDEDENKVEEKAKLSEQTSETELNEYEADHKKLHDQDENHSSLMVEQDSQKEVPGEPDLRTKSYTMEMFPGSESEEVRNQVDNSSMEMGQKDDLASIPKSEATDMPFESTMSKSDSGIMTKEDPTTGFDTKVANQHDAENLQIGSKEFEAEDACKAQAEAASSIPQESGFLGDKKEQMVEVSVSSFPITDFKDSNKTKRETESSTQEQIKLAKQASTTKLNEDKNNTHTFQDQSDHQSSLTTDCEPRETAEEKGDPETEEPSVPSLHDLLQKSRNANSKIAEEIKTESTQTMQNEEMKVGTAEGGSLGCDEPKPEEHKDEEVVEEDTKRDAEAETDSGEENVVMVEASRDATDVKVPHKKSHNILSGVGSKVKHSIAKVKKVITGKSSSPKPSSPTK
ncbi:OLC1v1011703C1 [Oldenlandia corymbosa var. corymbosa]|uniref:OLC1v1011703C1 n=1 Tax=Oldenlandia corymbosa var. corymbosa TaxID=529605 RepID=A0AAV1DXA7_OLDCO|nr:OLC1v1011703C1 [Oldenlandia corymbosa var. corymbosa]